MRCGPNTSSGGVLRRWAAGSPSQSSLQPAVSMARAAGAQAARALVSSSQAPLVGSPEPALGRRRPLPIPTSATVPWSGLGTGLQAPAVRTIASAPSAKGGGGGGGGSPQRRQREREQQRQRKKQASDLGGGVLSSLEAVLEGAAKSRPLAPTSAGAGAGAAAPAAAKASKAGVPWKGRKGQQRKAQAVEDGNKEVTRILEKYATIADVDGLLRLLEYAGLPLDVSMLTRAISACGAAKEPQKALGLLQEMQTRGMKPDIFAYSATVSALAKVGDWAGAYRVIEEMETAGGILANTHVLNHLLTAYTRAGKVDAALALLPEMWGPKWPRARPDTVTYNILINACVSKAPGKTKVKRALALAEEMRAKDIPFDGYTWAGVLAALAKQGLAKEALETLDAMKAAGAQPDVYCYNNAILACCRHHQSIGPEEGKGEAGAASSGLAMAVRLFLEMAERGVPMDAVSYNAILTACAQGGHWGGANRLIEDLARRGVLKSNTYLCVASLRFCATERDRALIKAVERGGLPEDAKAYAWLLTALRACELWEDVIRVAKDMKALAIPAEQWPLMAWNILLHAFARLRDGNQAYLTFWKLLRTPGVKPDDFTFLQTIDACAKSNQLNRALEVLNLAPKYGVPLDARHYMVAASACARFGQWRTVTSLLLGEAQSAGLTLDANAYTTILFSYGVGGEWQQALDLLGRLEKGIEPEAPPVTVSNYNAAIMGVSRAGKLDEVRKLLKRLRARGLRPDAFTYAVAINGCSRSGNAGEARRLFEEARTARGLALTMEVYGTMLDAYAKAGAVDEACSIFYAAQADPSLKPHKRYRSKKPRAGVVPHLGDDDEPDALLAAEEHGGLEALVPSLGGGGGAGEDHYLYTGLVSAFVDKGAWPAALYLYEDFVLTHGPTALQRPLITAVARGLNSEPGAPGGELLDAWLRKVYEEAYAMGVFGHWSKRWRSSVDLHVSTGPLARAAVKVALEEVVEGTVPVGLQGLQVIVGQSATVVREAVERALTQECSPPLVATTIPENPGRLLVPLESLQAWAAAAVAKAGGRASRIRVDPSIELTSKIDVRRAGDGGPVGDSGAGDRRPRQRWQVEFGEGSEGGK